MLKWLVTSSKSITGWESVCLLGSTITKLSNHPKLIKSYFKTLADPSRAVVTWRWNLWASCVKQQQVLRPWQCQIKHSANRTTPCTDQRICGFLLRALFSTIRFSLICHNSWMSLNVTYVTCYNRFNRSGRQAASHHDGKCHSGACDLRPATQWGLKAPLKWSTAGDIAAHQFLGFKQNWNMKSWFKKCRFSLM